MDDLISRSALIEEINNLLKSPYAKHPEPYTGMQVRKYAIETVRDLCVKNAPTAYDVDAVVKELEDSVVCGMFGAMFGKSDAEIIDIIKAGGLK